MLAGLERVAAHGSGESEDVALARAETLVLQLAWVNLIVALNAMALAYFYPFDRGASLAPIWARGIDEAMCLLSLTTLAVSRPIHRLLIDRWPAYLRPVVVLAGVAAGTIVLAGHSATAGYAYNVGKGVLLYSWIVPLVFALTPASRQKLIMGCSYIVVGSAFAQIVFSIILVSYWPQAALWRDDPLIGYHPLVGFLINPNRFALLLNIALAFLLAFLTKTSSWFRYIAGVVLSLTIVWTMPRTGSLSQLAVCLGVLAYATVSGAWLQRAALARLLPVCILGIFVVVLSPGPLAPKQSNVVSQLVSAPGAAQSNDVSNSISGRLADFRKLANYVRTSDPATLLFGGLLTGRYLHAHGDWWLVFFQFGLLGLTLFGAIVGLAWYASLHTKDLALNSSIAAFAATGLVDNVVAEFPTGLLFLVVHVGALAHAHDLSPDFLPIRNRVLG